MLGFMLIFKKKTDVFAIRFIVSLFSFGSGWSDKVQQLLTKLHCLCHSNILAGIRCEYFFVIYFNIFILSFYFFLYFILCWRLYFHLFYFFSFPYSASLDEFAMREVNDFVRFNGKCQDRCYETPSHYINIFFFFFQFQCICF